MQMLDWGDHLKTGIEIVDRQHKELADLANDMAARMAVSPPISQEEMCALLGCLLNHAESHFGTEEALMALTGVDERHADQHRQTHIQFLKQVRDMSTESGHGGFKASQLLDFLGNWLVCHVLGEDQSMGRQLRVITSGIAPEVAFRQEEGLPERRAMTAINRSLSRLYGFIVQRNQEVLAREKEEQGRRQQLLDLVARRTADLGTSDARFRALFANSALPVLIIPLEQGLLPGSIVEANPAACELLGYSSVELQTLPVQALFGDEDRARMPAIINELLVNGNFIWDVAHLTKAARRIMVRSNLILLALQSRLGIMAILQDLSVSEDRHPGETEKPEPAHPENPSPIRSSQGLNQSQHGVLELVQPGQSIAIGPSQAAAFLGRLALFQDISPEHLAPLALSSRERRLSKGEMLFQKGDRPRGLYLVIGGQVKLTISTAQGNEKVVDIFGPQSTFGEAEVFMDQPYPYFAQALSDTVLLHVGQVDLLDLFERDAAFARRLLSQLGGRLHDLVQNMESYTTRSGTERVVDYLLQHAYLQSNGRLEVELPTRKHVVASLLHLTPETLSRIFHNLSAAGLIAMERRHVHIPDRDRLLNCGLGDAQSAKVVTPRWKLQTVPEASSPSRRASSR